jgi:putative ABC transport system ATP-binding protein
MTTHMAALTAEDLKPPENPFAAQARSVRKVYGSGPTELEALRGVDFGVPKRTFTAIMGPSGSGKSTLMHCMAGLDTVTSGEVFIGDTSVTGLDDRGLTRLRRDRVGFVFQSFNLIPTLSVLENITLPLDLSGRTCNPDWLDEVVRTVGLTDRVHHRPAELSGGQQQRVACARAFIGRPEIVFGDEPTGNLDSRSGTEVLEFLRASVDTMDRTVVMVTHDPYAASYADIVVFLADGRIIDQISGPTQDAVLERMRRLEPAPAREKP